MKLNSLQKRSTMLKNYMITIKKHPRWLGYLNIHRTTFALLLFYSYANNIFWKLKKLFDRETFPFTA